MNVFRVITHGTRFIAATDVYRVHKKIIAVN